MSAHIVNQFLFDCVGENSLNIQEERWCYFATSPSVFYLVCDRKHGICHISTWSTSKLGQGEKIVFFGEIYDVFWAKGWENLGDGVDESYGVVRFGSVIKGLSDLVQH